MTMDWAGMKKRLGWGGASRSARFVLPTVALELQPGFVAGARLDGSGQRIRAIRVRELEPGALTPFANRANLSEAAAVRGIVAEVAEAVGNGGGRLGLVLPDASMRVAVLTFETLPERVREAEALVRWRMREVMPFDPAQARVCYEVLSRAKGSVEVLALGASTALLTEYEGVLEGINGGAALILPATLALLPLLSGDRPGGQLLLHVCGGSVTSAVVANDRLRFWRNRVLAPGTDEQQRGEIAREAGRVLATCRDHMKLEVTDILLCVRPLALAELTREISRELGREVQSLTSGSIHLEVLPPGDQDLIKRFGLTFAGLLANARQKA
jgi:type IV pilus assembly protein PilM